MRAKINIDRLPPFSPEAEAGFLGCCMLSPDQITERCKHVRAEVFYDRRNAIIWDQLKEMAEKHKVVDVITMQDQLKKKKLIEDAGGIAYLSELPDKTPSAANLEYYLEILLEKFAMRKTIAVCTETAARLYDYEGSLEDIMMGVRADIETVSALRTANAEPILKIWTVDELLKWQPPAHLQLIGDNEICMGYEGITLIAGPGSAGKSLALSSLALAGAIGSGTWQGRKVHRQFKTLIIQAENGRIRMKEEVGEMCKRHPNVDIRGHVFVSQPPEGGLPFHKPEFRSAVRKQIEVYQPSVVGLDTWAAIASEDSAKDVIDKLGEIRSCFPSGDKCPGLVILAHTKKPRAEEVRRGRGLSNSVSGSVALVNTARCVYMLLPWDEELEEERIYWACCKINNGKNYAASVWKRRFGTFFEHDPKTDPRTWGAEKKDAIDKRVLEAEDLIEAFGSESVLTKTAIANRLKEKLGVGYSTVMGAITPGSRGYLANMIELTREGWVKLKLRNGK